MGAMHVMGLEGVLNSFYGSIVTWSFAGRWASHMEKRRAAAQVTSFSSRPIEILRLKTEILRLKTEILRLKRQSR